MFVIIDIYSLHYDIMKRHICQCVCPAPTWLVNRGYNIAQAARKIGRSAAHVNMVIHGKRESVAVLNALRSLPERRFEPREAITTR